MPTLESRSGRTTTPAAATRTARPGTDQGRSDLFRMNDDALKALFAEQRRHAETLHEDVSRRFDIVAETITHPDGKIERTAAELRADIHRESEETRALLRLS